jgi:hypothetical protein
MVEIDIEENDNLTEDIYYDTGRHEDNIKRNATNSHDIVNNIFIVFICLRSLKQILFASESKTLP